MQTVLLKRGLVAGLTLFAMVVAGSGVAMAESMKPTAQPSTEQRQSTAKAGIAAVKTRLEDAKLKICQNREKVITNIMSRIADRGQKQITLFDTIAQRTEKFYTEKGKVLANYDALVADITAKKAAAQAEVDTLKSTTVEFKCDGTDPKGVASGFKDSLKAENDALKAYKTSIKNLIVGVKSVVGTTTKPAGSNE